MPSGIVYGGSCTLLFLSDNSCRIIRRRFRVDVNQRRSVRARSNATLLRVEQHNLVPNLMMTHGQIVCNATAGEENEDFLNGWSCIKSGHRAFDMNTRREAGDSARLSDSSQSDFNQSSRHTYAELRTRWLIERNSHGYSPRRWNERKRCDIWRAKTSIYQNSLSSAGPGVIKNE